MRSYLVAMITFGWMCIGVCESAVVINVVDTGSGVTLSSVGGTLDLTGLAAGLDALGGGFLNPAFPTVRIGGTADSLLNTYDGLTAPPTFSPIINLAASLPIGSVTTFGVSDTELQVPAGYVSNTPLPALPTTTFPGTIASLGITPGTHTWSWGGGGPTQSVVVSVVPEPSAFLFGGLISMVAIGGWWVKRQRSR